MMIHDKFFGFTVSVSILNVSFGVVKASLLLPEFRSGDTREKERNYNRQNFLARKLVGVCTPM